MASSSIELAAKNLGILLGEEIDFLAAVSDKVEELESELEWMQCFLWDADEKQNKNVLIRKWISEISYLALKAEDVIETYILRVSHKKQHGFRNYLKWLSCCLKDAKNLHDIGSDIDVLTAKIAKLTSRLQTYGVKGSYDMHSSHDMTKKLLADQKRTYYHVEDEDVVGFEECVNDLADKLLKDEQKIMVVHGMGGIGKSTLARKLFHHSPLKDRFIGFAWAYISQQLQLGPVCREILLQLIPENASEQRLLVQGLLDSQLPGKLCEMLKQNSYVIILDDMWFVRDWLSLEPAFPLNDSSSESKLVITTRNPQILADLNDNMVWYYEVKLLNREKSWELLQKKANFQKHSADPQMIELGDKMLDHCNGHPLAIVVLGGVLAKKKSKEGWQSVFEDLPFHLQRNELYNGVYEVLAMSYYELPYNLKHCFLQLVIFPEDFEISLERLYNLWIAEGIISSSPEKVTQRRSLDEVAQVYLKELVQKGMAQLGGKIYGEFTTCHLHDLMRDKGLEITKQENFTQVVDHQALQQHQASQSAPNYKCLRRLTIYVGQELNTSLAKALSGKLPPLRSILFFPGQKNNEESCEWIKAVCKDFELLRIFELEGLSLTGSFPIEVGKLIYLRYLSLKGTKITELPSSISKLKSLLILDLRVELGVVIKVPNLLWKLKNLRHLYFPSRHISQLVKRDEPYQIKDGSMLILDKLCYLEKLDGVHLDKLDEEGIQELARSLRKLTASCVSRKENLEPFLRSTSIKSMHLKIDAGLLREDHMLLSTCASLYDLYIDAVEGSSETYILPVRPKMYPQNLVHLDISYCKMEDDPIPVLAKLPNLLGVGLHVCYDGSKLAFPTDGFPALTYLAFDRLSNLREWTVEIGGLSKLQNLEIYNSPVDSIPTTLSKQITLSCHPCIPGVHRFGSCPYFQGRQ